MLRKIFAVITSLFIAGTGIVLASPSDPPVLSGESELRNQTTSIELATHRRKRSSNDDNTVIRRRDRNDNGRINSRRSRRSVEVGETPRLEAEEAIRNARRERLRTQARAVREGVAFPEDLAKQFDDLLVRSQSAFDRNDFLGAEDLAKGARRGFKAIERRVKRMNRVDNSGPGSRR